MGVAGIAALVAPHARGGERAIYTWQRSSLGNFVREVVNTVEN